MAVPRCERSLIRSADVVVAEVGQVAAEGVGLHGVGAGLEVGPVDCLQHVGTRLVEDLVAAFQAAEIVKREIGGLQLGAHRAVADHHPLRQSVQDVGVVAVFVNGSHPTRIVVLWNMPSGYRPPPAAPKQSAKVCAGNLVDAVR